MTGVICKCRNLIIYRTGWLSHLDSQSEEFKCIVGHFNAVNINGEDTHRRNTVENNGSKILILMFHLERRRFLATMVTTFT